jgi:glycosyltransferase involved in cell wall biosynthesis
MKVLGQPRENATESVPISVLVMTFNEEANIALCLQTVAGWATEIFVVDSFSTDKTEEIARSFPIHFVQHAYESAPAQWDWALRNLTFGNEWVLALDADFRVSAELKSALARELERVPPNVDGLYVRHRQVFRGRFIKHGTIYPRYWLRVFRHQAVYIDQNELVDQHFYVRGATRKIEFDIAEDNLKERDISFWVSKQLRFAERAAIEEVKRRSTGELSPITPSLFGSPDQRTLWLKERWYGFPLYWRAMLYFLYRYILRLGFLDGKEGFLYHFTQVLIYRTVVDTYIDEFTKSGMSADQWAKQLKPIGSRRSASGSLEAKKLEESRLKS